MVALCSSSRCADFVSSFVRSSCQENELRWFGVVLVVVCLSCLGFELVELVVKTICFSSSFFFFSKGMEEEFINIDIDDEDDEDDVQHEHAVREDENNKHGDRKSVV